MRALKSKLTLYLNFCFLECRPYDAERGGRCINVPEFQEKHLKSVDGQGHDAHLIPVVLDAPMAIPIAPPMELPAGSEDEMITVAGAKATSQAAVDPSNTLLNNAADARQNQREIQTHIDDLSVQTHDHFKLASKELGTLGGSYKDITDWLLLK